jgi:hypothetical protein
MALASQGGFVGLLSGTCSNANLLAFGAIVVLPFGGFRIGT